MNCVDQFPLSSVLFVAASVAVVGTDATEPSGSPWQCYIVDDSSTGADGVKLGDINCDGHQDIGFLTRICGYEATSF